MGLGLPERPELAWAWASGARGVSDGSPKGRDEDSVYDSRFPKGHALTKASLPSCAISRLHGDYMGMTDDDDTVYCDIQMPVAEGRELLQLVNTLRDSKAYPRLDKVFEHMQYELSTTIDIVDNPPTWGPWRH